MKIDAKTRQHLDGRFQGMSTERYSWWCHWRELADYILPRRYRWLLTPNQVQRGSPINGNIIDSTGTIAARTCASGMMAGITSPTRSWFKLGLEGFESVDTNNAVSIWLSEVERRMRRVFSESNFYNSIATMYHDLTVFGSALMLIYEDYDDVIRCYNPCVGEFYFANGSTGAVNVVYREFTYSLPQMVERFGEENLLEADRNLYKQGGPGLRIERVIRHCIEPNDPPFPGLAKDMKFREVYWVRGSQSDHCLEVRGYKEFCALAGRWDLSGNDAYGRSPGMDALGDIKQLQQEQRRKAQALDKMVNPPMLADIQLKNQPASSIPGGITYIAGNPANTVGFKPAYQINPPFQELMLDIQQVQERIRSTFFNDLFMMISQLQTVRSATEIDARREEKLIMLGPVLERFENEVLDPAIERTFNIMMRGGLLPPPPPELQGQELEVEYVSMLAEAQKAASSAGLERLMAFVGNIVGVQPAALDGINIDKAIARYATIMSVDPEVIRSEEELAAIRQQAQSQQQAQQMMEMGAGGAKAAQTLSKTDVGGGLNALQMMMGGA